MPIRRVAWGLLLVVPLLVLASVSALGITTRVTRQPAEGVPAPQEWVAFSAAVTVWYPGKEVTRGRQYQFSDGSVRLESWHESQPDDKLISIQSISTNRSLVGRGRNWSAAPLKLPPHGWKPFQFRKSTPGLTKYTAKLDIGAAGSGSLRSTNGFEAYVYSDRDGTSSFLVPALNFLPVVRQSLFNGRRMEITQIEIGPPATELLSPPPDVEIREESTPRGIVYTPNPNAP